MLHRRKRKERERDKVSLFLFPLYVSKATGYLRVNVPVLLNLEGWHLLGGGAVKSSGSSDTEVTAATESTRVGPGEGAIVGVHVKVSLEGVLVVNSVGDSGGEGLSAQVVSWLDGEVVVAVDPAQGQVAVVGTVDIYKMERGEGGNGVRDVCIGELSCL